MAFPTTGQLPPVAHSLIYGPAKIGKTRSIITAPTPLICSVDKGLESIRDANLPYHPVNSYADYIKFEQMIGQGCAQGHQSVFLDDLTELAEMFLAERKPHHKNLMQAYGELNDEMMRVIRFWRAQTTFTSIIICKQERIKEEATGLMLYAPEIPGKAVAPKLPYLFGTVLHMELYTDPETGTVSEVVRCKKNDQCDAGDRSGKLAPIEFVNWTNLINKMLT